MNSRMKYTQNKTQLTVAELKDNLAKAQESLKRATYELGNAQQTLKWARDKLVEAQEENRQLKLIIIRMTEERDGKH